MDLLSSLRKMSPESVDQEYSDQYSFIHRAVVQMLERFLQASDQQLYCNQPELSLERFTAGRRIRTIRSEAMVLSQRVDCPLQVGGEVLPQEEDFKYLVLFSVREERRQDWCSICNDQTRVVLSPTSESHSDYINASFIKGPSGDCRYIASQGPLSSTLVDFWRMIWQHKIKVIVMACRETEMGKRKCENYWAPVLQSAAFGPFTVSNQREVRHNEDLLVRTLTVCYQQVPVRTGSSGLDSQSIIVPQERSSQKVNMNETYAVINKPKKAQQPPPEPTYTVVATPSSGDRMLPSSHHYDNDYTQAPAAPIYSAVKPRRPLTLQQAATPIYDMAAPVDPREGSDYHLVSAANHDYEDVSSEINVNSFCSPGGIGFNCRVQKPRGPRDPPAEWSRLER
ncbi:tyrosine-protein phosphatase non-receptor type 18 [Nematolebias whitei]|uniref:tyrosine-protein phosphatase non-receptor type 18 n=1 Tax=Nematolebias whitei TaxID=451745 RepID=UPI00189A0D14|nr:tyrosine-protein phosphatase non-receptor type 18 [Nematolebias whitei]